MRKIGILILFIFCITITVQAQNEEKTLSLSLGNCIVKAMENNLGVAIEVLSPELADIAVAQAGEKFMPSLSLNFSKSDQNQASYSWLDASGQLQTTYNDYSLQVDQQIPTGGNLSLRLSSSMYDTNRTGMTINPSYRSTLRFSFSQPLLKDFGPKMSRKDIIIAKNNLMISEKDFKKAIQDTVYNVEEAYWNLVYAIEDLKVKQQSLHLAEDLLAKNRRAVEVGTMAPIEIINAQASVAQQEANILAAEAQVKNNEDRLRTIINLAADYPQAGVIEIIPKDTPAYEKKDMKLDEALSIAMQNRPDLQSARLGLKNNEMDLSYAKNQLLPNLSFTAAYWSPGVSGDRLIYPEGFPFGDPIDVVPGGISDSFKDVFDFRYKNWSVGLTLDVPISNILSRASYAQASVNLEQAKLRLKDQEQQVFTDIKIAVRNVETSYRQIQALQAARKLAERQLEAEEEKLKVGLTTNYFVLQYQTDLSTSRSQELQAIINYNLALAQLNRDLGISLKEKNIQIENMIGY